MKAKTTKTTTAAKPKVMELEVIERRIYLVPEILQAAMRVAIRSGDEEEQDELIGCLEYRVGAEEVHTLKLRIVKGGK